MQIKVMRLYFNIKMMKNSRYENDIANISQPHADHIGQLKRVVENFSVGEVWMSGNSANSDVFTEAMEAVEKSDASYEEPSTGDVFDVGPLVLTVLHPDQ